MTNCIGYITILLALLFIALGMGVIFFDTFVEFTLFLAAGFVTAFFSVLYVILLNRDNKVRQKKYLEELFK